MAIALPDLYPLASLSLDAAALAPLWTDWSTLRDAPLEARDHAFTAAARSLADRFVVHRDALFRANAVIQGDDPLDERADTAARIEANQHATKLCTVALSEIASALGLTSEPATPATAAPTA